MFSPALRRLRPPATLLRTFVCTPRHNAKRAQMPPRPKVAEDEFEEIFLKGSGPGGQKINKTSSAVQLIHKPTGLVIKSQATRSRSMNRKIARGLLAEKLEFLEKGTESRVGKLAERDRKKKASKTKKAKRKYKKLEMEKQGDLVEGGEVQEGALGEGEWRVGEEEEEEAEFVERESREGAEEDESGEGIEEAVHSDGAEEEGVAAQGIEPQSRQSVEEDPGQNGKKEGPEGRMSG